MIVIHLFLRWSVHLTLSCIPYAVLLSSIIVAQVRFTPFSFLSFLRNIFKPKHAFMFLFAFILWFAHIRSPFLVGWLNFSQLTWLTCWFVMLWRTFVVYLKKLFIIFVSNSLDSLWLQVQRWTTKINNFFFFCSFWTMRLEMCIAFYISLHFKMIVWEIMEKNYLNIEMH